jgi:hypothetical protein
MILIYYKYILINLAISRQFPENYPLSSRRKPTEKKIDGQSLAGRPNGLDESGCETLVAEG